MLNPLKIKIQFLSLQFFIGSLLISSIALGQNPLIGKYSTQKNYTGFTYTFKKDSSFTCINWSCLGSSIGVGNYKILNDSIFFTFSNPHSTFIVFEDEINTSKSDSVELVFLTIDSLTNEPIPYSQITLTSGDNKIFDDISDLTGTCKFYIKKSDKLMVIIRSLNYPITKFSMTAMNNKKVKIINYYRRADNILAGTVLKYKIIENNQNGLLLQNDGFNFFLTKEDK